jgi:hypothetical protein
MTEPQEPSPEYTALEEAVHAFVASEEYQSGGMLTGWALLTVEHDMTNGSEAQGVIYPPHQSRTTSRGLIESVRDMMAAHAFAHQLFTEEDDDADDEED